MLTLPCVELGGSPMNVFVISLALNIAIGLTVWQSALQPTVKLLLTVALIVKFGIFLFTVFVNSQDWPRKFGSIALVVLNVAIMIYTFLENEYYISIATAGTLVMFCIWVISRFTPKKDNSDRSEFARKGG